MSYASFLVKVTSRRFYGPDLPLVVAAMKCCTMKDNLEKGDGPMNFVVRRWLINSVFVWSALSTTMSVGFAQSSARDPGVRPVIDWSRIGGWPSEACPSIILRPLPGLTDSEEKLFCAGAEEFAKEDKVKEDGLGPTMNLTSCLGCHQYPISGGSSPLGKNPQYDFARSYRANG